MRHHGMLVCVAIAAVGASAVFCGAQATREAGGGAEGGPELVPVPTKKSGAEPGPPGPGAPAAEKPAGDANAPGPRPAARSQDQTGFGNMWFYVVLLGGFVLLYFWMGRSRRKQEAKRKEMLASLKKNDKVVTIGGIMGTVIEARPDEITIKVDETNNVRMKFARWAVRGVGEEARQASEEEKK